MRKSGKSTLAIDKAIQNFFNSKCICDDPKPMFAVIVDTSPPDSYHSAGVAVDRLATEHGIHAEVIAKANGIFIYEVENVQECSDEDADPLIQKLEELAAKKAPEGLSTDLDAIKVAPLTKEEVDNTPDADEADPSE